MPCRCRYDVKYGSAGFNSFGYKAGCEFALGTYAEAMAVPEAAQYLCPKDMDKRYMCLHDHSGDGVCYSSDNWDGFFRALPVRISPPEPTPSALRCRARLSIRISARTCVCLGCCVRCSKAQCSGLRRLNAM